MKWWVADGRKSGSLLPRSPVVLTLRERSGQVTLQGTGRRIDNRVSNVSTISQHLGIGNSFGNHSSRIFVSPRGYRRKLMTSDHLRLIRLTGWPWMDCTPRPHGCPAVAFQESLLQHLRRDLCLAFARKCEKSGVREMILNQSWRIQRALYHLLLCFTQQQFSAKRRLPVIFNALFYFGSLAFRSYASSIDNLSGCWKLQTSYVTALASAASQRSTKTWPRLPSGKLT